VSLPIFLITCFVAAELGQLGAAMSPTLALYWPSTGVLLAILLGRERRSWPVWMAVAAAAICLSLIAHGSPLMVGALAAGMTTFDALLAAAEAGFLALLLERLDDVFHGRPSDMVEAR